MKWEMEIDEIESVLEKIWDLHDKLSDAIHSISRAHFLSSISSRRRRPSSAAGADDVRRPGFVFVKDFRPDSDDDNEAAAIHEAKSLNAIRTALENLEDHFEIFHVQQRADKDAAIARLEQSRIILAMRLAEHNGKKYKVIEEALAFVGDVQEANRLVSPEKKPREDSPSSSSGENLASQEKKRPSIVHNVLVSCFDFAKRTLRLDFLGGVLGNAAMVAISMVALLHLQQTALARHRLNDDEGVVFPNRRASQTSRLQESSPDNGSINLDVLLARG